MVLAVTPPYRVVAGTLCCAVVAATVAAAEESKRSYRLPRGEAAAVLAQFATECGRPILFMMDAVRGEQTNALAGTYTPREALDRLLAGTALFAVHDPKSDGFIVNRRAAPGEPGEKREAGSNPESVTAPRKQLKSQESSSMKNRNRSLSALLLGLLASAAPTAHAADVPENRALRDGAIQLTPFEVVGDSDTSYGAINSNSITRFNTELSKLPVSADIMTETFMADVAAVSVEDMIVGHHAGSGMSYSDAGSATTQPGDRNAESAVQIRGLYTPTMQRDGFLPLWTYSTSSSTGTGYTSNFDIERVEVIKGPQSLLYGSGGGGGVINTVSKQARLGKRPFGSFTYKIDQFGSKSGQFDFGFGNRTLGTSKSYAQLYNDQFYQNDRGQVTYQDGSVVHVRPTYIASQHASQPTVPEGTPGAIPLTIAMMSSPGNSYYANPTPVTGQISSSSAAAQVLRWVHPTHGPILTGVSGLPISAMQIDPGFKPPGVIPATVAGDVTTGYPKYSLNLTSMYTFSTGLAQGLRVGGTLGLSWQHRGHYFYPGGIGVDSNRTLFFRPDRRRVDFVLGYERRLGRFTWSTQVNVQNAFNRYEVIVLPSSVTGYAGVLNATFSEQPRSYVWSNTIKF